jgi:2-dehydro-3-deoxyphosphogluconate aldolase/(4S)-4-hydroxy-2-oxoglutarate aldolase
VVKNKILPVVTLNQLSDAKPLAEALEAAGMDVLEITLRTDSAMEAIALLGQNPNLIIGVGSITSIQQLKQVHSLGAKFAVSPGIEQSLVEAALELGLMYIPGVATSSEIMLGMKCGLKTLKFFPSETLGGVAALKAISAPFPGMSFIPTGGINIENMESYLELDNVKAVGGSWMVSPKLLKNENYEEISRLAKSALDQCRGERLSQTL